jgi:hypothetical protein
MSTQEALFVKVSSLNVIGKVVKSLSWSGSGESEQKLGGWDLDHASRREVLTRKNGGMENDGEQNSSEEGRCWK